MKTWKSSGVFVVLLFIAAFGYLSSSSAGYEQAEHGRRFADLLEKAAKEAQALANGHESMAQAVAGSGK
jgi:hypothetical protein